MKTWIRRREIPLLLLPPLLAAAVSCSGTGETAAGAGDPAPGDGLLLSFEKEEWTVLPAGDEDREETREATLHVLLEPRLLTVTEDGRRTVYDFEARRVFYLKPDERTYQEASLYALVGFRAEEFRNRMLLARLLDEAEGRVVEGRIGGEEDLLGPLETETLFGLEDDARNRDRIQARSRWRRIEYGWDGEKAVEVRPSEHPVPAGLAEALEKFLIYECRIHPEIRRRILALQRLPAELDFRFAQRGAETRVRLVLKGRDGAGRTDRPVAAEYRRSDPDGAGLYEITGSVRSGDAEDRRLSGDAFLDLAREAAGRGNHLEAALAVFEHSLQSGERPEEMFEILRDAGDSEPVSRLFQAVAANQAGQFQAALRILDSLDRTDLTRAHVIDIFRAFARGGMQDAGAAIDLLLGVLRANPFLTGAYKDLGDLYFRSSDMNLAWECWDTARALRPGHRLLQSVDDYETSLVEGHPEFF